MNEQELEKLVESDIARAFRKLYKKYEWAKRGIIVSLVLIALGCSFGIQQVNHLSEARKADSVQTQRQLCDNSRDGRQVLRQLITNSTQPNTTKVSNPELQRAIADANARAVKFESYALGRLPLPDCDNIVK